VKEIEGEVRSRNVTLVQLMLNVYYFFSATLLSYLPTELDIGDPRKHWVGLVSGCQIRTWRESPNNIVKANLTFILW